MTRATLAMAMLAACGGKIYSPDQTILLQPDACLGADHVAIASAAKAWNDLGAHFVLAGTADVILPMTCLTPDALAQLPGQETAAPGHETAGDYDPNDGAVKINAQLWAMPGNYHPTLVAHELGHAIGLQHVADATAVMYWSPAQPTPNSTDIAQLCSLYSDLPGCR